MININSIDSHNSTVLLQTVNVFTVPALVGSAVAPSSEVVTHPHCQNPTIFQS